jgi:hypothetical protein
MSEIFVISAVPSVKNVRPKVLTLLNDTLSAIEKLDFTVKGKMFFQLRNVYLSASNPLMFEGITFYNNFSAVKNLSANNLGFSAFLLPNFSYTENFITFTIPYPQISGFFDIIVENEAGYGKLSESYYTSLSAGVRVVRFNINN